MGGSEVLVARDTTGALSSSRCLAQSSNPRVCLTQAVWLTELPAVLTQCSVGRPHFYMHSLAVQKVRGTFRDQKMQS